MKDYVFGNITNDPLAIDGVAMSSPALADLPVVSAPDVAAITLFDGNEYEIIHVTDHVALSDTATILRAQEGSVAKEWPVGSRWNHGLTAEDTSKTIRGTGFPEGVVTAPVGTEYVDEAATNGAVKWIKQSGSGSTGWQVIYGDTGWRKVISAGDYAPLPGVRVFVRRIGRMVTCCITEESLGTKTGWSGGIWTIAGGFEVDRDLEGPLISPGALTTSPGANPYSDSAIVATTVVGMTGMQPTRLHHGRLQWVALHPWPSTLPGTAV